MRDLMKVLDRRDAAVEERVVGRLLEELKG